MGHVLADLLANDHPLFTYNLQLMEKAAGNAGVDTRLIADITEKAHAFMRSIGVDPADTSGPELYHVLNAAVERGNLLPFVGLEFVLLPFDDGPVSFNLHDVIENAHHTLDYEHRTNAHGKRHLRAEIIRRYADHDRTDNTLIHQLAEEIGMKPAKDEGHTELDVQAASAAVNSAPHILAVGDIITDAFIKLSEDHAETYTDDKGYKRLSFELGAKLPYDEVEIVQAVECSPNAAVSVSRLGLNASLMAWLGDDQPGQEMVDYLKAQSVGTEDLVIEKGMKSNYHYVLRYGADRTKLQRFEDYMYEWHEPSRRPDWLYLGVLGEKTWPLHEALLDYLADNSDIKLVFQPGMYHLMWGTEKMKPFYERAEVVIMNREEAAQVTGKDRGDVAQLLESLHELGVTVAVVTDGADGAYASDGKKKLFMPNYPDPQPPLDRTGAGDAFASTIAAALALGEPLETALKWAPINSMSVVQQLGAQAGLLSRSELEQYLAEAPDGYVPSEM